MVRSLPPRDESVENSPEAARGTKLHSALERRSTLELDEAETAAYENALRNESIAVAQWQSELGLNVVTEGERELRLWLRNERGEPTCSGKAICRWCRAD